MKRVRLDWTRRMVTRPAAVAPSCAVAVLSLVTAVARRHSARTAKNRYRCFKTRPPVAVLLYRPPVRVLSSPSFKFYARPTRSRWRSLLGREYRRWQVADLRQ